MKQIFVNLKRFDLPAEFGGVNRLAPISEWGAHIVKNVEAGLSEFPGAEFVLFFPEAHLITAGLARSDSSPIQLGCQSVYRDDAAVGGNFGAFTSNRPAAAAAALGCKWALIGHCEERNDKAGILAAAGVSDPVAVNLLLNKELRAAADRGLRVLYCIGERAEEQESWEEVLEMQLRLGLDGVDPDLVSIAYEPVWAIGPGKTPPGRDYIEKIARFVKKQTRGRPLVYGGGLKADNAEMLASIPEIDGGLIALTRFSGEIGFYPQEYLKIIRLYLA